MNLPRTISPETMLTMSWISPFCKRNIRFRFHRNGDSIDVKHAIRQIRLFRRTCPPSLPSPISSYRGGVWYLKRREKERERVADEIDKQNEQMERDRYDLRK